MKQTDNPEPSNAEHFVVKHVVEAPLDQVWATFAHDAKSLFEALSPPFPKAKLIAFGGTEVGAVVKLDLDFGLWTSHWESIVTEQFITDTACWFIDQGSILPLGLSYFRHRHLLTATGPNQTTIAEEITLAGNNWFTTQINLIGFKGQMQARGPIYTKYWANKKQ
jgi:ligand-binding SRPBCC domain-containing protein